MVSARGHQYYLLFTSGEFEGTAEDVTATDIEIGQEMDLAIDPSSGAQTKLTTLVLDRGIPFDTVRALAMDEAQKLQSDSDSENRIDDENKASIDINDEKNNDTLFIDEYPAPVQIVAVCILVFILLATATFILNRRQFPPSVEN